MPEQEYQPDCRLPKEASPDAFTDRELTELTFSDLMKELANGSEEAAWIVAERYSPHIQRAVRASLPTAIRSKVDSIDLINSLWGAMLVDRGYLAQCSEPAQLIALLTKAAKNRVIEEHRKYTICQARDIKREAGPFEERMTPERRVKFQESAGGPRSFNNDTPSQFAIAREMWDALLDGLDPQDRAIMTLRVRGLTYQEIANQVTTVSISTVRRTVERVVGELLK